MKTTGMQTVRIGLAAFVAVGCSGGAVDIGDEGEKSNSSALSAFAGSYDGQIENWEAKSGSSRIRIELDAEGHGTVRFGDRPIQSAPNHPYPDNEGLADWSPPELLETAVYPVNEPSLEDGTLEFFVETGDLFDSFCEAQADPSVTPPCDMPNVYTLYSGDTCFAIDEDGLQDDTQVLCSRGRICYDFDACECSEDTCKPRDFRQIYLRLSREEDQLTGDVRFTEEPVVHELNFD